MEDFDELVAAARERGMGIMLDMVLCHTSNQHEWFQRALAGEERHQRYSGDILRWLVARFNLGAA